MEGSGGSEQTPWRLPDAPVFYRHPLHIYRIEAMAAKLDQNVERVGGHGPMRLSPLCRWRCLRRFCGLATMLGTASACRPMKNAEVAAVPSRHAMVKRTKRRAEVRKVSLAKRGRETPCAPG
jgi:hypothetical protein